MQVPAPMPKGREGKTTRGSGTPDAHMQGGQYSSEREGKKTGGTKGKTNQPTNKKLLCDDVKMSGCGISNIPKSSVHAMRHEWLETG